MKQKVPANIFGPQMYCPWCVSLSLRESLEKIKLKLNLNKFENLNFFKFATEISMLFIAVKVDRYFTETTYMWCKM